MVAHGYLAYLIRVAPPHRERSLQTLSSMGSANVDLLDEVQRELQSLGSSFHRNPLLAEGFRKRTHTRRGRSIHLWMRRGPVGSLGETFDTESETSTETGLSTALLSELRTSFYIPAGSYFGFLFVERVGGRHLKDLVVQKIIKPISLAHQVNIRVEGFALSDDWRRELSTKQVLRVTELLQPRDSAHDASTLDELQVRVAVEGAGLSRRGDDIKSMIFDVIDRRHRKYRELARIAPLERRRTVWSEIQKRDGTVAHGWKRAPKNAFTAADEQEWLAIKDDIAALDVDAVSDELRSDLQSVLPVDRGEYESRRLEVSFGDERPERSFVIAGDRVPQLVYEFGERLLDTQLLAAWDATAVQFLGTLGVTLPPGWPVEST